MAGAKRGRRRRCIPLEIVEEILCWLPVKSLNRFRTVSTSWQCLISDNRFIRKHINIGASQNQKIRFVLNGRWENILADEHLHRLSLSSVGIHNSSAYLNWFPISSLLSTPLKVARYLLDSTVVSKRYNIIGSCDGLLCVSVDHQIYILNPCMKTCRRIPHNVDAFGYDSTTDDYKLISVSGHFSSMNSRIETNVYSLKKKSWRKVVHGNFPTRFLKTFNSCCLFANGHIYWLAFSYSSTSVPHEFVLVMFDFSEDEIVEVSLPDFLSVQRGCCDLVKLSVLRGMLSVILCNNENKCLELWLMKDCTDHESWTRMLAVPLELVCSSGSLLDFKAFYLYENDEVLVGAIPRDGSKALGLICKDSRVLSMEIISHAPHFYFGDDNGFVLVESVILLW